MMHGTVNIKKSQCTFWSVLSCVLLYWHAAGRIVIRCTTY